MAEIIQKIELVDNRDKLGATIVTDVTLKTSKGPLQFAVYNEHNGYYGHAAWVRSNQLTKETCR